MSTLFTEYKEIVGAPTSLQASQEHLDRIGHYLDEMERVEAYMESSQCSQAEYLDCESERLFLCDQLDALIEDV